MQDLVTREILSLFHFVKSPSKDNNLLPKMLFGTTKTDITHYVEEVHPWIPLVKHEIHSSVIVVVCRGS